jgi:hypothetical protein
LGTAATWYGGVVPGADDNVFINGYLLLDWDRSCSNLTINTDGSLQMPYWQRHFSLTISGNLENHGTIRNGDSQDWAVSVYLAGDLANYGTLANSNFYLNNPGQCSLWMDSAAPPISCKTFKFLSVAGTYQALSDLRFSGNWSSNFDLNNHTLILHDGGQSYGLYFHGGFNLKNGTLEGGTASFLHAETDSWVHLSNLSMDDITWRGSIIMNGPNISVNNLINQGTIHNQQDGSYSLTINESLENHGTIRNVGNNSYLTVNLAGNLANYGTISNHPFNLTNTGQSSLWMDPDAPPISCVVFQSQSATGTYQALSDLRFSGIGNWSTTVNLNNRTLILHDGEQSFGLHFDGGVHLINGILEGVSTSFLHAESWVALSNLSMDDITWRGSIIMNGPNISVNNLINRGTIHNQQDGSYSLTINESLENRGTIRNVGNNRYLTVYLAGDLANYGTISNHPFNLTNTGQSSLWMDPDAPPISCRVFQSLSDTGTYQALSDLSFSGDWSTPVNLNNRTLILHQGEQSFGLHFGASGGNLINGILEGGPASFLHAESYVHISNLTMDKITWRGSVIMNGPNISVNNLINRGTIHNQQDGSYSLTVNESLVNYGTICNAGNNRYLTVYMAGDLANYGTIRNSTVYINGTQNQDIMNVGTISVGNFYLVSEIGAAAWYFNNVLSGSFQNHAQIAISVANLGVWLPRNTSGDGRLITIGNIAAFLSAPENVSSYLSGSELKLRWNQVPGALHYNVYYAEYPEGPFTTLLSQVFDSNLSDGFVQADLSGSEPHRFYQVRAGN